MAILLLLVHTASAKRFTKFAVKSCAATSTYLPLSPSSVLLRAAYEIWLERNFVAYMMFGVFQTQFFSVVGAASSRIHHRRCFTIIALYTHTEPHTQFFSWKFHIVQLRLWLWVSGIEKATTTIRRWLAGWLVRMVGDGENSIFLWLHHKRFA